MWLDWIFSPLVGPWAFLARVPSADHSRRAAARLDARRVARGRRPCSARTGAYCRARRRPPVRFFSEATRAAGGTRPYRDLLPATAARRVAGRPDRYEPRVGKRRRNRYGRPTRPRAEMRRGMAKRSSRM